jgi:hypothetical protein
MPRKRKFRLMSRLALVLSLAPLLAIAQTDDLATVSGQVVNAATGEPIRKAIIAFRKAQGSVSAYSITTDSAGAFHVADLPPGTYRVGADRQGFVGMEYGARAAGRMGTNLVVAPGQKITDMVFRLLPQGVVTGRVTDEDGDPVQNASVQLVRYQWSGPRRQMLIGSGANTNDLGEYRIFDIAPGKYMLRVTYNRLRTRTTAQQDEEYIITWYPRAREESAAAQLEVTPGAQLRNIDVSLIKGHTVRVRGRIATDAPEGPEGYQIVLSPVSGGSSAGTGANSRGEFELRGVLPGSYVLIAHSSRRGSLYSARRLLTVGAGNVEDMVIQTSPAAAITGRVRVDKEAAQLPPNLQIYLIPAEPGNYSIGPTTPGKLGQDGSFKIESVAADRYIVMLTGLLPEGYYIKAIRAGTADVLLTGLDVSAGAPDPLDVVISPNAGEVSGTAQNTATQQPAAIVPVVLVPTEKERRGLSMFYKNMATDSSGRFTFRNVPPGEYKVFAWEDVENGSWFDPEFLKPIEGRGEAVTVREGGKETVQVTVIPAQ